MPSCKYCKSLTGFGPVWHSVREDECPVNSYVDLLWVSALIPVIWGGFLCCCLCGIWIRTAFQMASFIAKARTEKDRLRMSGANTEGVDHIAADLENVKKELETYQNIHQPDMA